MSTTAPKMTLWLATALISTTWQSKATTASASTGAPVLRVDHDPAAKRWVLTAPVRPANTSAKGWPSAPRVLTQKTLFSRRIGPPWLRRLRHTRRGGGGARPQQTGLAVETVVPPRPAVRTPTTAGARRPHGARGPS